MTTSFTVPSFRPPASAAPSAAVPPAPSAAAVAPAVPDFAAPPAAPATPAAPSVPDFAAPGGLARPVTGVPSAPPAPSAAPAPVPGFAAANPAPYAPPASLVPAAPPIPGKAEPQYTRDRNSYVVPHPDDPAFSTTFVRATRLAHVLDDTSKLADWQVRGTVLGLARHPELLDRIGCADAAHIRSLEYGDRFPLMRAARDAQRRVGCQDGSEHGTLIHGWLEAVVEGVATMEQVPAYVRPHLEVIFAAMRQQGLSFVRGMCERTVIIPETGMVGTLDFMAVTADGETVIGDLKTSANIDYGWLGIATQLAQYANATMMLSLDRSRWEPMPPVSADFAVVISVPMPGPDVRSEVPATEAPSGRAYIVNLDLGAELMRTAARVERLRETALARASDPDSAEPGEEMVAWAAGPQVGAGATVGT